MGATKAGSFGELPFRRAGDSLFSFSAPLTCACGTARTVKGDYYTSFIGILQAERQEMPEIR
jgi:hypothetical protein